MLDILLVVLLIMGFFIIAYKGAVHEFQILQKDWKPTIDWSSLLEEQLPLVIRNVDSTWQGTWTRKTTGSKTWPIQVQKDGSLFKTRWNEWISAPPGQPPLTPETQHEITTLVKPPIELWEDGGFRRWSWIPAHLTNSYCHLLSPMDFLPVERTKAAATLLQATDGAPLQVWLAHEGAIPAKVSSAIVGRNPWLLQEKDVPWITEVKFVEIRLRPGNALVIPTHWYWAVRSDAGNVGTMGDGSWFWSATWNTPISWLVSKISRTNK